MKSSLVFIHDLLLVLLLVILVADFASAVYLFCTLFFTEVFFSFFRRKRFFFNFFFSDLDDVLSFATIQSWGIEISFQSIFLLFIAGKTAQFFIFLNNFNQRFPACFERVKRESSF